MTLTVLVLLKIAVAALIFAIGMSSTLADLTYLWRRPALLWRSVFAMYLLVPLAAFMLVHLFPVAPAVKAALFVLAISAGAPLLPRQLNTVESHAYAFSLVVSSSFIAILLVPAAISVFSQHFDVHQELHMGIVAWVLAKAFLLPLAAGMFARFLFPSLCVRYADAVMTIAGVVMTGAGLVLLALEWEILKEVHWQGIAALVCVMVVALIAGHLSGGPEADNRTILAIACSTRHIGIAILVAGAFPSTNTLVLVAAYSVTSAVVSIPYMLWRRNAAN